jgi:exopolyphosphatase/guanosine-5'-triphosphate,3'-diphosphate pyrophosphatase
MSTPRRPHERYAAVDCGTNTVLLTIAERDDEGRLQPITEHAEITRLGEGLAHSGRLAEAAIARTELVFARYAELIAEAHCTQVLAVATEALRRAANGADAQARFAAQLARVGGTLEIIGGEREAALSFRAARDSFPQLRGRRAVVDIGGGSTEIVVGERGIESAISLPIGSVVLTERYLAEDPPSIEERAALAAAVDHALAAAPPLPSLVVGIAGTVTTYAAIALGLDDYDATRVHGLSLARSALDAEVARLGALPVADRRRTPGLQAGRADVIYAGGVILSRVLARAQATHCLVSDRGVRWGLLYEAAG